MEGFGPVVDVAWLIAHLDDSDLCIVDARNTDEYQSVHITGAVNVDLFSLHWFDTSPTGIEGFRRLHEDALGAAGIRSTDTVVFYDATSGMLAARGVWVLEAFGHSKVAMLDGGLTAWRATGGSLQSEPTTLPAAHYRSRWRPEVAASFDEVRDAISAPEKTILDTRSREEYLAQLVRAKHGGAVPGARHLEWTNNLAGDGRFKAPADLEKLYAAIGVRPEDEVITYCQGGYRAANTYVALRLAGFTQVKNYFGSWGEWGNRDDLPIETPKA